MAVVLVGLPGIITIENDANQRWLIGAFKLLLDILKTLHEIRHGNLRIPLTIDKADHIRELAVAKNDRKLSAFSAQDMRPIQL